jgi:hypothetical protein
MKDLQYTISWWKEQSHSSYGTIKKIPVKRLKKITEYIGKYNDKLILINLMETYTFEKKRSVTQANLLSKWEEERALSRKKLISRIQHIKW